MIPYLELLIDVSTDVISKKDWCVPQRKNNPEKNHLTLVCQSANSAVFVGGGGGGGSHELSTKSS